MAHAPQSSLRTARDADGLFQPSSSTPYTIFTTRHKHVMTLLLGLSTLVSPLTATTYFPLLPMLQAHFDVSTQAINLTITLYIVFQAVSPIIFATTSDFVGRRPVILGTFILFTVSSLGLALNRHSYAGLLVLRAIQSLGASAVLAVAWGVVADVCVPADKGKMAGPNDGGIKSRIKHWSRAFLPETARYVVGNGSQQLGRWDDPWWNALKKRRRGRASSKAQEGQVEDCRKGDDGLSESTARCKRKFKIGNPLTCIRIIFWKDTALVLWVAGSFYAIYYCIQTSIPSIYKEVYGFDELKIGLSFLTGGTGVVVGGYVNGKMMDRNYRATARELGHSIDTVSGDDLNHFPIEKARSRRSYYLLAVSTASLTGYGWVIHAHGHVSIPLILQFIHGFVCTCFLQTFNALMVDIFPETPSTAATSSSVTRCALSAVGVALTQPLIDALGRGGFFTFLGLLSGLGGTAAVWTIQTKGMKWRTQRRSIRCGN